MKPGKRAGVRSNDCERLRLHHRRRGLRRLRAGQPAERRRRGERAFARSGTGRPSPLYLDSARHGPHARLRDVRLGLSDRERAQSERPPYRGDARQGARRLVVDQCHGLYARQSRRLRPLGAERRARLVLCRCAAVFQARRNLGGWRESLPRRLGAARHPVRQDARSAVRCLDGRRQGARPAHDRGLQRRNAGRHRPRPIHHPRRTAFVVGARLSAAGPQPGQPHRRHRRACDTGADAGHPRHRRRICPRQRRHGPRRS